MKLVSKELWASEAWICRILAGGYRAEGRTNRQLQHGQEYTYVVQLRITNPMLVAELERMKSW